MRQVERRRNRFAFARPTPWSTVSDACVKPDSRALQESIHDMLRSVSICGHEQRLALCDSLGRWSLLEPEEDTLEKYVETVLIVHDSIKSQWLAAPVGVLVL